MHYENKKLSDSISAVTIPLVRVVFMFGEETQLWMGCSSLHRLKALERNARNCKDFSKDAVVKIIAHI